MRFLQELAADRAATLKALGGQVAGGGAVVPASVEAACAAVEQAAQARWCYHRFALGADMALQEAGIVLPGGDIARHLAGCDAVVLIALTLGQQVDALLRTAAAADVEQSVLRDTAASVLAEQYADAAEEWLRAKVQGEGLYLTARFSPGYGDLPLSLQAELIRLVDGPRAIGLTVNAGGILLPRKSITALLGVSTRNVKGRPAGCDTCAVRQTCETYKEGASCARFDFS